ncbi:MAG: MoaD/ThiS family protein [bacterium]
MKKQSTVVPIGKKDARTIELIFYSPLKRFVTQDRQMLALNGANSVRDIIVAQGVPSEQLFYTMVLVNERKVPLATIVRDGDRVEVFQPIGGG